MNSPEVASISFGNNSLKSFLGSVKQDISSLFLETGKCIKSLSFFDEITSSIMFGDTDKNQISFTFDDGNDPEYIRKILDILKEKDIQATFFIIGENIEKYPDLRKEAVANGHQICNHTQTHHYFNNDILYNQNESIIHTEDNIREKTDQLTYANLSETRKNQLTEEITKLDTILGHKNVIFTLKVLQKLNSKKNIKNQIQKLQQIQTETTTPNEPQKLQREIDRLKTVISDRDKHEYDSGARDKLLKYHEQQLLCIEILGREQIVSQNLGERYLQTMKSEYPFFRFPGGAFTKNLVKTVKESGYLPVYRSDEPKKWSWNTRSSYKLGGSEILLFHFDKKNTDALNQYLNIAEGQGDFVPLSKILSTDEKSKYIQQRSISGGLLHFRRKLHGI